MTTLLTQTRKSRGLSLETVAAKVSTDPTNLSRVEKGQQLPKKELARALFKFYGGVVPIGLIYDANSASQACPYCGEQTHARKSRRKAAAAAVAS